MAGYSKTPLLKKLGIKENFTVYLHDAPDHYLALLGEFPEGVKIYTDITADLDFIHLFARQKEQLTAALLWLKDKTWNWPQTMRIS